MAHHPKLGLVGALALALSTCAAVGTTGSPPPGCAMAELVDAPYFPVPLGQDRRLAVASSLCEVGEPPLRRLTRPRGRRIARCTFQPSFKSALTLRIEEASCELLAARPVDRGDRFLGVEREWTQVPGCAALVDQFVEAVRPEPEGAADPRVLVIRCDGTELTLEVVGEHGHLTASALRPTRRESGTRLSEACEALVKAASHTNPRVWTPQQLSVG